jgi:ribulose-phosphate 3-epimerase
VAEREGVRPGSGTPALGGPALGGPAASERTVRIVPSILSADFTCLGQQVLDAIESGATRIHVDVMDGRFVPNLTMGPLVVEALKPICADRGVELEAHLMIVDPDQYLDDFRRAGSDILIVHAEASRHLHRTISTVHELGARACAAVNPGTSLSAVEEVLDDVEQVLVMTVDPGFGGQDLIPSAVRKVTRLRAMLDERALGHVDIEVDGGVKAGNIAEVAAAGANLAVCGSSVFERTLPVATAMGRLRRALEARGA